MKPPRGARSNRNEAVSTYDIRRLHPLAAPLNRAAGDPRAARWRRQKDVRSNYTNLTNLRLPT